MESSEVKVVFSTVDIDDAGFRMPDSHEFDGHFSEKDGIAYVSYKMTDEEGRVSGVLIKFSDSEMSYKISGVSSSNMKFSVGGRSKCDYMTPFGKLELVVVTSKYLVERKSDNIKITTDYILELRDGSNMTKREMKINIRLNN